MDGHPSQLPDVLRHHGNRWQIRHDDQYNVWIALCQPTPASPRYVVAYDLPALAAKLDVIAADETQPSGASRPVAG